MCVISTSSASETVVLLALNVHPPSSTAHTSFASTCVCVLLPIAHRRKESKEKGFWHGSVTAGLYSNKTKLLYRRIDRATIVSSLCVISTEISHETHNNDSFEQLEPNLPADLRRERHQLARMRSNVSPWRLTFYLKICNS
jgi:hypothetical protein